MIKNLNDPLIPSLYDDYMVESIKELIDYIGIDYWIVYFNYEDNTPTYLVILC